MFCIFGDFKNSYSLIIPKTGTYKKKTIKDDFYLILNCGSRFLPKHSDSVIIGIYKGTTINLLKRLSNKQLYV